MSLNRNRFFTDGYKQKEIFTNKKGLKKFSRMITHEKRFSQVIMNKKRFSQIKISSAYK